MKNRITGFTVCLLGVMCLAQGCRISPEAAYYGVYREVPPTAIVSDGWLRTLLEIQRDGLGTHRAESGYPYNTCLWEGNIPKGGNPIAKAWWPYEQSGYLVDGLYRCGIFLQDTALIALGRRNAEYVLNHPRPNGMLGPQALEDGQWAFSVFARTLMADYAVSRDRRIIDGLKNHFAALPDSLTNRQTCIIESMGWVYGQTGDRATIEHADRIWNRFSVGGTADNEFFRHGDMVESKHVSVHGVTAAEVSKQPAILYLYTGKKEYLDAALGFYGSVERDHELADGIPASYEKLLGKAPEALHETCDVSDFMWSYGYLMLATGDTHWADKIESAFYNAALGSVSKDFRSHQYFSSPNQVVATQFSSIADYGDEGLSRQAYRPGFDTECCSGNVHRMFPNYVSRMWLRDNRGGIVAALYAPSTFSASIGGGKVTVTQETDYPFDGQIVFRFDMKTPVEFPFTVRIPGWAGGASVRVNDEILRAVRAGTFHTIDRRFSPGDSIILSLPMEVRTVQTAGNGVSLYRGPLLFSVCIAENATEITGQMKTSREFPAYDIVPASEWNYALDREPVVSVECRNVDGFPWLPGSTPVKLKARAWRIPGWKYDRTTPSLPVAGFRTAPEPETIEMIPSGATRIRLTTLPVKTDGQ